MLCVAVRAKPFRMYNTYFAGCGPGRAVNVALSAQPSQLKVLVQSIGLKYRPVFRYRVQVLLASIGRVSDTSIGIGTSLAYNQWQPRITGVSQAVFVSRLVRAAALMKVPYLCFMCN